MKRHGRATAGMSWGALVVALTTSVAWAQTTGPATATRPAGGGAPPSHENPQVGVIKGANVYVRSGFSTNYYPVTKLNRGDTVTIVGEEFGWVEIRPPAGTYSLLDKTYVDRVDDDTGKVNQKTWAIAGSDMDVRRYAKQVELSAGAKVDILGETEDKAYFKITPPPGATLWVKGDLVDRTGAAGSPLPPDLEPVKPGDLDLQRPMAPEAGVRPPSGTPRKAPTAPRGKPLASPPSTAGAEDKYQIQINASEAEIKAESAKSLESRMFEPILNKLQPLADQKEDDVARLYATARIEQLRNHIDTVAAVREIRELRENSLAVADGIKKQRDLIRARPAGPVDDIVVRGMIQVSGIYSGGAGRLRRWRVVDRESKRTLAYIEVPAGSPIDPVQYYGHYVGIRASAHQQLPGTIPPVSIFTVAEIQVLSPQETGDRAVGEAVPASPKPPTIETPASQPASGSGGTTRPAPADAEKR